MYAGHLCQVQVKFQAIVFKSQFKSQIFEVELKSQVHSLESKVKSQVLSLNPSQVSSL